MAVTVLSSLFWSAMLSWMPEARAITAGEQAVAFVDDDEEEGGLGLELELELPLDEALVSNVMISTVDSLEWRLNDTANTVVAKTKRSVLEVKKRISNTGKE